MATTNIGRGNGSGCKSYGDGSNDTDGRYRGPVKDCGCEHECCCGQTVGVTIPKNILNYEAPCIKWCRPGKNDAVETIDVEAFGLERTSVIIAGTANAEPGCTNSIMVLESNLDVEFDLSCFFDRTVQIEDINFSMPSGTKTIQSVVSDCEGTTFELAVSLNVETTQDYCVPGMTTILDISDVDSTGSFVEDAILPVHVASVPRCSTSVFDLDVNIEIGISV